MCIVCVLTWSLLGTKNEKSKDYCKADLKQRVLFFITIFRLAILAFFRFTDVLYILADLISSREI